MYDVGHNTKKQSRASTINDCTTKRNKSVILMNNMVDISAYNAFILWTSINIDWNSNALTKIKLLLEEISKYLISVYISSIKKVTNQWRIS